MKRPSKKQLAARARRKERRLAQKTVDMIEREQARGSFDSWPTQTFVAFDEDGYTVRSHDGGRTWTRMR